jgi:hypothetical protein
LYAGFFGNQYSFQTFCERKIVLTDCLIQYFISVLSPKTCLFSDSDRLRCRGLFDVLAAELSSAYVQLFRFSNEPLIDFIDGLSDKVGIQRKLSSQSRNFSDSNSVLQV